MFKSLVAADIHVIGSFNVAFVIFEWSLLSFVIIEQESHKRGPGFDLPV